MNSVLLFQFAVVTGNCDKHGASWSAEDALSQDQDSRHLLDALWSGSANLPQWVDGTAVSGYYARWLECHICSSHYLWEWSTSREYLVVYAFYFGFFCTSLYNQQYSAVRRLIAFSSSRVRPLEILGVPVSVPFPIRPVVVLTRSWTKCTCRLDTILPLVELYNSMNCCLFDWVSICFILF